MTNLNDLVSHNVRLLTTARGTTPTAISRELGHSHHWIQAKLAGRNRWTVGDLEEVAGALQVTAGELVDEAWSLELVKRPRNDGGSRPGEDESRSVRPKGLEPPTFCLVPAALLACIASGSAQFTETPSASAPLAVAAPLDHRGHTSRAGAEGWGLAA